MSTVQADLYPSRQHSHPGWQDLSDNSPIMHTVEKIGGTSMSRFDEVLNSIFIGQRRGKQLYNRIFVVSAYSGMTNLLLEH